MIVSAFILCCCWLQLSAANFYANNYPYIGAAIDSVQAGSTISSDSHGAADNSAFSAKKAHDRGNDVLSAQHGLQFYDKDNALKGHDIVRMKTGSSVDDHKHVIGQNVETDKSHNRKHIKSGFHNTYNKDESGTNSSFYEDSDDRGGKLAYDKSHGVTGDQSDRRYREGLRDGQMRDRLDDRFGAYDRRDSQDRQHYVEQDRGNRQGYSDKYDRGQQAGERLSSYKEERPPATIGGGGSRHYYQPMPIVDRRRPIDYPYPVSSYINNGAGHSPHLPIGNELPRPLLQPLDGGGGGGGQDDGYFSRHRITIYDDPRELIDPRRVEVGDRFMHGNTMGGGGSIYHTPRLDFRPSPLRLRGGGGGDYYDEKRDNFRYRHRDY